MDGADGAGYLMGPCVHADVVRWLEDIKVGAEAKSVPDVTPEVVEYVIMEGNRDRVDSHGHPETFQTLQEKIIHPDGFGQGKCWHTLHSSPSFVPLPPWAAGCHRSCRAPRSPNKWQP